jgi:hypothetical protein
MKGPRVLRTPALGSLGPAPDAAFLRREGVRA